MRKSILTLVILAGLQMLSFAQQGADDFDLTANMELVEKIVDEKSDITGTIANAGGWNIFVDDAKTKIEGKLIKKFSDKNMQSLLQKGYQFSKKSKAKKYICYRYRIATMQDGSQEMYLYECP